MSGGFDNSRVTFRGARFERSFLLLAALCVLLMPSVFKGGAETPHPHSFFQFWLSGPERAFDHHHGESENAEHAEHEHSALHHGAAAEVNAAVSDPAETPAIPFDPDVPSVSPADAPGGVVAMFMVIGLLAIALAAPALRPWRYSPLRADARGRSDSPEPPPPRGRLALNFV
jgi:hypothetical protein